MPKTLTLADRRARLVAAIAARNSDLALESDELRRLDFELSELSSDSFLFIEQAVIVAFEIRCDCGVLWEVTGDGEILRNGKPSYG